MTRHGLTGGLARRLARRGRDEDGGATFEFVLLFPLMISMLMMSAEAGLLLTRQAMMERGLDVAMRELRLGTWDNPDQDTLRQAICDNATSIPDCENVMLIELQPIDPDTWALPAEPTTCVDRDDNMQPVVTLNSGGSNEIMLVRACMVVDPIFPTSNWGLRLQLDSSGGYQMRTASLFVNEPR